MGAANHTIFSESHITMTGHSHFLYKMKFYGHKLDLIVANLSAGQKEIIP